MADIIRLRGSPHAQTETLLPWYVHGTLDAEEAELVETHLAECAECREELEAERVLALRVASAPFDVAHGWALVDPEAKLPVPSVDAKVVPIFRRRVALGWAVAAQAAAAALILVASTSLQPAPSPAYHALGSAPVSQAGNAVILFAPDTPERAISTMLRAVDARLVDGPTDTGAYVLRLAPDRRDRALAQLRQSHDILLAEPIDPGPQP